MHFPSIIRNATDAYGLRSEENSNSIISLTRGDLSKSHLDIADIMAKPIIEGLFRAVLCLLLFVGVLYLLKSGFAVIENIFGENVRTTHNVALCSLLGVFKGLVVLTLIISSLRLILPCLPVDLPIFSGAFTERSLIYDMMANQNPIIVFLAKGIFTLAPI